MKKLKYDKKKKEYSGVAYMVNPSWVDSEIIIMGPTVLEIRRFYEGTGGYKLNPKLCAKLKVKVTRDRSCRSPKSK